MAFAIPMASPTNCKLRVDGEPMSWKRGMTFLLVGLGLTALLSACSKDSDSGGGGSGSGKAKSAQLSDQSQPQPQNISVSPVSGMTILLSRFKSTPGVLLSGLQVRGKVQLFSDPACSVALSQKVPVRRPQQGLATTPLPFGKHFIYAKSWDSAGNASACSTVFATYLYQEAVEDHYPRNISAGKAHTCAIVDSAGRVKCWGHGKIGQLAANATDNSDVPLAILTGGEGSEALAGVVQIDAGGGHTNALMKSGKVKYWGQNHDEFIVYADKGFTQRGTPSQVLNKDRSALSGVVQTSSGKAHACVLKSSGEVKCWGWGNYGELGNGTKSTKEHPTTVIAAQGSSNSLSGIVHINSGNEHTCALTKSGGVKCWGNGTTGQLGNGTFNTALSPVDVIAAQGSSDLLSGIVQISSGDEHSCALTNSQTVLCWGDRSYGQLGQRVSNANFSAPVAVPSLSGIVQIAVGNDHSCALSRTGMVFCWGRGDSGQLGNGHFRTSATPVKVIQGQDTTAPLSGVLQIVAGGAHACALRTSGEIKCWGEGDYGRLGNDSKVDKAYPVTVVSSEGSSTPLKVEAPNLSFSCLTTGACAWDDFSLIALSLKSPETSPNSLSTPQISVSPVEQGDQVSLHSDPLCASAALAEGGVGENSESIDLVTTELVAKENKIYARVGNLCSSSFVFYVYSEGTPRLALETESPSSNKTPTVSANFLSTGDVLSLHLKNDCTDTPMAEKTAGEARESLVTSELGEDGFYLISFKQNGICYPDGIIYQLKTSS